MTLKIIRATAITLLLIATFVVSIKIGVGQIPIEVKDVTKCMSDFTTYGFVTSAKHAHAQQPKSPEVPDKIALQVRNEQLAQAKMREEFQSIQKQIDDSPLGKRMKELQAQYVESDKKMKEMAKGVCGDEKLWSIDFDALKCVAVKSEAAKKE